MNTPRSTLFKIGLTVLVLAGISLWFRNWWAGRSLFLDEANLALNLAERSFAGFFAPLDYQQYAPPLFMALSKSIAEIFGYGERVLRILPLVGGLLGASMIFKAGRKLPLSAWALLPLALLFANPIVLHYVTDFKPYGLDLGLAATIIYLICRSPRPHWWWLLLGLVYPWLSMPGVFVLAATGLYGMTYAEHRRRWLMYAVVWVTGFAAYYWLILRSDAATPHLVNHHAYYFFPLRIFDFDNFTRAFWLVVIYLQKATGATIVALFFAIVSAGAGWLDLLRRGDRRWMVLLLPLFLAVLVSGMRLYSMMPRMMLFSYPGFLLLAGKGAQVIYQLIADKTAAREDRGGRWYKYAWLAVAVITVGGTNVTKHYARPVRYSLLREMVSDLEKKPTFYHHFSVPGVRYYQEVHPRRTELALPVYEPELTFTDLLDSTRFQAVYELLTDRRVRNAMKRDSLIAAGEGYAVTRKPYGSGAVLMGEK